MDVHARLVRRSHRAEPLTPSPIVLPAEAIAVTLVIFILALGVMTRGGA
jgi:hypothetical protein